MVYSGGDLPRLINSVMTGCQFRLDEATLRGLEFLHGLHVGGAQDVVRDMLASVTTDAPIETPPTIN